ncbi:MAG: sulfite exporter TauE/SafE family protein [Burkholderiales bacterium]|nr:sulfite exporter TauE/SafE family protein [Burkholderiales bacterium]
MFPALSNAIASWWATLPIVTTPSFYAIAVPAALLLGLSKSGFLSGFGSLVVPLLALVVPVPQAAAIMLPLLFVSDGSGIVQLWRDRDRAVLRLILPAGLLGTGVGTLLFGLLSTKTVSAVVGGMTLMFLAQRLVFPPRADAPPPRKPVGFLLGIAAGFSSFVAHAGGPPISAYALALRMRPITFTATMAVFFAAVNLSKWSPYAWLGLIDTRNMTTSLVLLPLAPIGVWLGIWLTRRIRPTWFYLMAYGSMGLAGAKLLWDGLH